MGMAYTQETGKIICTFDHDMDTGACLDIEDGFDAMLNECGRQQAALVFDMTGVNYIASSFLRLCGKAAQQVGTERLTLVSVAPMVKKVFKIAGLADRLNIG